MFNRLRRVLAGMALTPHTPSRIVHNVVNHQSSRLDRVFLALGDPTRRAILTRLARDHAVSTSALAEPFEIKLPAVMKHLDVLEEVGLIRRTKQGRTVTVELSPRTLLVGQPGSPGPLCGAEGARSPGAR